MDSQSQSVQSECSSWIVVVVWVPFLEKINKSTKLRKSDQKKHNNLSELICPAKSENHEYLFDYI